MPRSPAFCRLTKAALTGRVARRAGPAAALGDGADMPRPPRMLVYARRRRFGALSRLRYALRASSFARHDGRRDALMRARAWRRR